MIYNKSCAILKKKHISKEIRMTAENKKPLSIEEIDKNMATAIKINKEGLCFYSMYDEPFVICGGLKRGDDGRLYRLPRDVAEKTSPGVLGLCTNTAGGRVRFKTDSKRVAIVAKYAGVTYMSHFAITGSVGLDLYADDEFVGEFRPPLSMPSNTYESLLTIKGEKRERNITVNLPIYSNLVELYIGVDEGSSIASPAPYTYEKPIVYYGSSVTQGGCASRPGTTYQAYLTRWLDWDHVNLGFSGSAMAEDSIVEYMASIENMGVFVCDYDHNSPSAEYLNATHLPLYRKIREKNPDLPIIIFGRTTRDYDGEDVLRRKVTERTYEIAISEGDKNVYYVNPLDTFPITPEEATVDRIHPTDLGFYFMAKALEPTLKEIAKRYK